MHALKYWASDRPSAETISFLLNNALARDKGPFAKYARDAFT